LPSSRRSPVTNSNSRRHHDTHHRRTARAGLPGLPPIPGRREPRVFYFYEIYADTDAFRAHLATGHVAHFFTELARHSTTGAKALVQLIELDTA